MAARYQAGNGPGPPPMDLARRQHHTALGLHRNEFDISQFRSASSTPDPDLAGPVQLFALGASMTYRLILAE